MFDALFHGDLRAMYYESKRTALAQGKGLRVKLRIVAPELAALPWEYLYDAREGEYICLSHGTPVVRYLEVAQPPRPLTVTTPLRILGMVASPRGLPELNVDVEKERLERAVADLQAEGLVELEWLEGETWRDLSKAMRPTRGPWHVFHFIGHGGFDRHRDEGFLAVCNRQGERYDLTATQLGRLLADHRTLRLVVLNACEGAQGSNYDIFSSAAATLVRRGIPAVVAMQYEITDQAAIEFAEQLYRHPGRGPAGRHGRYRSAASRSAWPSTTRWNGAFRFSSCKRRMGCSLPWRRGRQRVRTRSKLRRRPRVKRWWRSTSRTPDVQPKRPKDSERLSGDRLSGDRLSGDKVKELLAALLDAYSSESSLRQMVRIELDENIDVVAGGGDLREKIFNLIDWAERTGRLPELVEKAHQFNPGNVRLRTFAETVPGVTTVAEARTAKAEPEKRTPASPVDIEWVTIPAGEFLMGSDKQQDSMAYDDEEPQHKVYLPEYRIARVPVTNGPVSGVRR